MKTRNIVGAIWLGLTMLGIASSSNAADCRPICGSKFCCIANSQAKTRGTDALLLAQGSCDYAWQTDSAGRRCGGRAASVIPGGRLGGDGRYTDSQGRPRLWGRNNDPYDQPRGFGFQTHQGSGYGTWTTTPLWGTQQQGRLPGKQERRRYNDW